MSTNPPQTSPKSPLAPKLNFRFYEERVKNTNPVGFSNMEVRL